MAVYKGYEGKVLWGTVSDGTLTPSSDMILSDVGYRTHSWTLDIEGDTEDITDFDSSGWRIHTGTVKGWSGSIEAYVDDANIVQVSDLHHQAELRLYLDSDHYFKGQGILTGRHPAHTIDGVATQSLDFQGTSDCKFSDIS